MSSLRPFRYVLSFVTGILVQGVGSISIHTIDPHLC
nr:MAG TPA: hypothetical protein [Caudoviricetes sp.]